MLIDHSVLELSKGLTMITGETGAGKSILLGALGLIQGKRADLSTIRDAARKCIVEATFDISQLNLLKVFENHDLDYDKETIVRREILPSGKSRAFINDTPVTLTVLSELGRQLIDIHSQHETLELGKDKFQLDVLQSYVNYRTKDENTTAKQILHDYHTELKLYNQLVVSLTELRDKETQLIKESDYNQYLLNELEEAQLDGVDLISIEKEQEQLSNIGLIKDNLNFSQAIIDADEVGLLEQLRLLKNRIDELKAFDEFYEEHAKRILSIIIEIEDVNFELSRKYDVVDADPKRLEELEQKLQQLDNLFRKHQVDSLDALLQIRDQIAESVFENSDIKRKVTQIEERLKQSEKQLSLLGQKLFQLRSKYAPELSNEITTLVSKLGIPQAYFEIKVRVMGKFQAHGIDEVGFYFTANKGIKPQPIHKVASGGELSRLMLCVKSLFSSYKKLPTIIFDEIDTGVSGAIAEKMASIMKDMSAVIQVITITHLPQIAASGNKHLLVSKSTDEARTTTAITELSKIERVEEIAQMLSGGSISEAARDNARVLLG